MLFDYVQKLTSVISVSIISTSPVVPVSALIDVMEKLSAVSSCRMLVGSSRGIFLRKCGAPPSPGIPSAPDLSYGFPRLPCRGSAVPPFMTSGDLGLCSQEARGGGWMRSFPADAF